MTNKEKAREFCGCSNCYHNLKGSECLKDNGILCCLKPCLKNTLQAMEWKDEQHTKEKQQWIDKAAEWIDNNVNHYIFENEYGETYIKYTFTEDFIKAMKGE